MTSLYTNTVIIYTFPGGNGRNKFLAAALISALIQQTLLRIPVMLWLVISEQPDF